MQKVLHIVEWLGIMAILALVSIGLWVLTGGGQSVSALKWLQAIQSVAIFILPPILCALLWYKKDWKTALGLSNSQSSIFNLQSSISILLMLIASPGISLLSYWNQSITFPPCLAELESSLRAMEEQALELIEGFVKAPNMEVLVANLFVIAILPAFGEELTFRGLLFTFFHPTAQRPARAHFHFHSHSFSDSGHPTPLNSQLSTLNYSKLYTLNSQLIIWLSAIIFSAVHMQFFGFIPRMLLGALFGYVYVWSGSLWLPIIMHATNNAFAVIMYNVFDWCGKDPAALDTFGTGDTLWVGILSLILTAVGIYFFRLLLLRRR